MTVLQGVYCSVLCIINFIVVVIGLYGVIDGGEADW